MNKKKLELRWILLIVLIIVNGCVNTSSTTTSYNLVNNFSNSKYSTKPFIINKISNGEIKFNNVLESNLKLKKIIYKSYFIYFIEYEAQPYDNNILIFKPLNNNNNYNKYIFHIRGGIIGYSNNRSNYIKYFVKSCNEHTNILNYYSSSLKKIQKEGDLMSYILHKNGSITKTIDFGQKSDDLDIFEIHNKHKEKILVAILVYNPYETSLRTALDSILNNITDKQYSKFKKIYDNLKDNDIYSITTKKIIAKLKEKCLQSFNNTYICNNFVDFFLAFKAVEKMAEYICEESYE